jgi:hypothetical protein
MPGQGRQDGCVGLPIQTEGSDRAAYTTDHAPPVAENTKAPYLFSTPELESWMAGAGAADAFSMEAEEVHRRRHAPWALPGDTSGGGGRRGCTRGREG